MLGSFRFLLASLVVIAHTLYAFMPLNLGASAVIGFYFLSGMLMAVVYAEFQQMSERPVRSFFWDRAFRLLPAFYLVFALKMIYYASPYALKHPGLLDVLSNALVLPTAYQPFIESPNVISVIGVSWSLGVEFHFYLALPILMTLSLKHLRWVFYVLLVGHMLSLTQTQLFKDTIFGCGAPTSKYCDEAINEIFGYWFPIFAGVFFVFGVLIQREAEHRRTPLLTGFFCAYLFEYLFYLSTYGDNPWLKDLHHLSVEVVYGALILVPAAYFMVRDYLDPHHKVPRIDLYLGKLAYPLFLCHLLVMEVGKFSQSFYALKAFTFSLILAAFVAAFQTKVDKFRYRFRGFRRATDVRREQQREVPAGVDGSGADIEIAPVSTMAQRTLEPAGKAKDSVLP